MRVCACASDGVAPAEAWEDGYIQLHRFVESTLDAYRSELEDLLWPVLAHTYLELVRLDFHHHAMR